MAHLRQMLLGVCLPTQLDRSCTFEGCDPLDGGGFVCVCRIRLTYPDAQRDGLEGAVEGLGNILKYMSARQFIRTYRINSDVSGGIRRC
jgi:hypothetical protein